MRKHDRTPIHRSNKINTLFFSLSVLPMHKHTTEHLYTHYHTYMHISTYLIPLLFHLRTSICEIHTIQCNVNTLVRLPINNHLYKPTSNKTYIYIDK